MHDRALADGKRRRWVAAALAIGLAGTAPLSTARAAGARSQPLPGARSLTVLLNRSREHQEPLVAFFSRDDCPWCELVRREQLIHLAREAKARGVQVVEFNLGDARRFAAAGHGVGEPAWAGASSSLDLAQRLSIQVTPTVAFLGQAGELAERLVGYPSRDFYGAYLDQRIEQARSALRSTDSGPGSGPIKPR